MQGGVARRRTIKKDVFLGIEIPLPPLDEQKRIAAVLEKADALRRLRQQSLNLTEKLIQSTFLDMFGDPVRNPNKWQTGSLQDYGSFKNGLNYKKGDSGVRIRCIGVGDFQNHATIEDVSEILELELKEAPSKDYFLEDGDLLLVRSNGNRALVGRCLSVYPREQTVSYSGFCIRYRITSDELNPSYVVHLFRNKSFRDYMLSTGRGANIQNISQQMLNDLDIPIPPPERQQEFSDAERKIRDHEGLLQRASGFDQQLFRSLQQRAFRGDLDLRNLILEEEAGEIIEATDKLNELVHETLPRTVGSGISLKALKPSASVEKKLKSQDKVIEENEQIPWSPDYFKFRLLAKQTEEISITNLMSQAESIFTEPNYDAIRDILFDCLDPAQGAPFLTQTFDENRKEIILQPA
ncbi:hypothetical protein GCM10007100_23790 [Roseibacillus persicicus]|uniref:Type I restriction modification DNA specificity domain-containing protein n=2 Tax=Roseibacillus persicicus TaxID=454148 RepID=A0A918WL21_9BACT|nr:hypothetical protein GCM10007100_23790 [Roseibacillus persicicus]